MRSLALMVMCITCGAMHAQSACVVAGGDALGTGGSLAWSIGQVACMAVSTPGGAVHEGVQQPYGDIGTGSNGPSGIPEVHVFPTATPDRLIIEWRAGAPGHAWAELVDASGARVRVWLLRDPRSEMNIGSLAVGHYRLLVWTTGSSPIVFPIIRTP